MIRSTRLALVATLTLPFVAALASAAAPTAATEDVAAELFCPVTPLPMAAVGGIIQTTDALCGTFPTLEETCHCWCKVCVNPHLVSDPQVACQRCRTCPADDGGALEP